MKNAVYVYRDDSCEYPQAGDGYSPSVNYPEYSLGTVSTRENRVYDAVRECFHGMGMDEGHFGSEEWNPLGDIIKPGNTVLIKPNFVLHTNQQRGMDCLVTHPAVLRAVIDYVLIALKGGGRLTVGDAPVQGCDFAELLSNAHYDEVLKFYRDKDVNMDFVDFRGTVTRRGKMGRLFQRAVPGAHDAAKVVNIGEDSAFYSLEHTERLRITNYDRSDLHSHHHDSVHEYMLTRHALDADVIINLPKPKTHRKAGITAALKNLVGLNVEKNYLPHHTQGGKNRGGDEYPVENPLRRMFSKFCDASDRANSRGNAVGAFIFWLFRGFTLLLMRAFLRNGRTRISEGSWYGNDTIWRTVNDLNRIALYADKDGILRDGRQRVIFTVADMITLGEGEGPLMPSPKHAGMIVAAANSVDADGVICRLMGVPVSDIPCIRNAGFGHRYVIGSDSPEVLSNDPSICAARVEDLDEKKFDKVIMSAGWRRD